MKKTKRYSALLLSLLLLLLFALFSACGDTEQADDSGQTSDRAENVRPAPDDLDLHDSLFPGKNVPRYPLVSFETYRTLLDGATQGGEAMEKALTVAKDLKGHYQPGSGEKDENAVLRTAEQIETLVKEIGGAKILVPQAEEWTFHHLSRGSSGSLFKNEEIGLFYRNPYRKSLLIIYKNETLGNISMTVYYDDAERAHNEREFYNLSLIKISGNISEADSVYRFVSPAPLLSLPLDTGEVFTVFTYRDGQFHAFLITDSSEIVFKFSFQVDDKPTLVTDEEKEAAIRDFLKGAKVMTLNEAANSVNP